MKLYMLVSFLSAAVLSMSLFLSSGDAIERNLAGSLNLRLSCRNSGYFAGTEEETLYMQNPDLNQKVTDRFLKDLEQLCQDSDLAYADYSLAIDVMAKENDVLTSGYLYGIRDFRYFEQNGIVLHDFEKEDFSEDTVILPVSMKKEGLQKGARYELVDSSDWNTVILELKVAGFYEDNRWMLAGEDPIVSDSPALVSNETILQILKENPQYYGQLNATDGTLIGQMRICNLSFTVKNIEGYSRFSEKLNAFTMKENSGFARIISEGGEQTLLGLQTNISSFGSVLKSIHRIRYIYEFIFIGIWVLLLVSMTGLISFIQEKNVRDIGIRRALGERKKNILLFYSRYYVIPAFLILLPGIVSGYLMSAFLSNRIYENSLSIQKQMSELTGTIMKTDVSSRIILDSTGQIMKMAVLVVVIMSGVICVITCVTTLLIMREKIRKQMRGEIV